MNIEVLFHHDGGHGWLEIEKKTLRYLKIHDKISTCSYMKGNKAFLEEDCDFSVFVKAMEPKCKDKPDWGAFIDSVQHPVDCKTCNLGDDSISNIRNFQSYRSKN
jgi:hypothetical protein